MIAPSDVLLVEPNPLGSTFGRSEREVAAALIVRALQVRGGSWGPVTFAELEALVARADPWTIAILSNPFHRPEFFDLIAKGFARWLEPPADDDPSAIERFHDAGGTIELTDVGIDRLARSIWIRRAS